MRALVVEGWVWLGDEDGGWSRDAVTWCSHCQTQAVRPVSEAIAGGAFTCPQCSAITIYDPDIMLAVSLPPPFARVIDAAEEAVRTTESISRAGADPSPEIITELSLAIAKLAVALMFAGRNAWTFPIPLELRTPPAPPRPDLGGES